MINAPSGTTPQDVTVVRIIAASPERIWSAWTSPSELPQFFAHPGTTIAPDSLTMDVRPGGALRLTVVEADGECVTTDAVYVDVDEPALVSWHWTTTGASGAGETMISITEVSGGTEVTSRMVGHLGPAAAISYRRGVMASLEALERLVG